MPLSEFGGVGIKESIGNGQSFFTPHLERTSGLPVDLGLSFRTPESAAAEQAVVSKAVRQPSGQ